MASKYKLYSNSLPHQKSEIRTLKKRKYKPKCLQIPEGYFLVTQQIFQRVMSVLDCFIRASLEDRI